MDLFTGNAAYTLQAERARNAEREAQFRRIAKERKTELTAAAPAKPARERRTWVLGFLHLRVRSAH